MAAFFRQFSFPGGVPSHCAPETPGSFHEGGELGYSLLHAYGAALDNPDLTVFCVVGDGEAETGPLATSWHCNKFLNPARDGAVLPILRAEPVQDRQPDAPGPDPRARAAGAAARLRLRRRTWSAATTRRPCTRRWPRYAGAVPGPDRARSSTGPARGGDRSRRPAWPMIVLRTPKGWTCPPVVDGQQVEGTFRAHQVPLPAARTDDGHRTVLEQWLRSYRPEELFDDAGRPVPELLDAGAGRRPADERQPGRQRRHPAARSAAARLAGLRRRRSTAPGATQHEATRVLGGWLRDVTAAQPDELPDLRPGRAGQQPAAGHPRGHRPRLAGRRSASTTSSSTRSGRVIEVLSEHMCQGLLEGYLLTGRHGRVHLLRGVHPHRRRDVQPARQVAGGQRPGAVATADRQPELPAVLARLAAGPQRVHPPGPGLPRRGAEQEPEIVRVYLPPDANTLLSTYDHCLRSRHYVNVVVAGKQPQADWLSVDDAALHCARGAGIWEWAGHRRRRRARSRTWCSPAPVTSRRWRRWPRRPSCAQRLPDLRVRVVNVVDLMRLLPETEHPHGLPDSEFDTLFTADRPVIFAFHGYPWLIHRLTYRRTNHDRAARPRLQGEGHHHNAVRHGDAQRPRPLPPGHRRHRPRAWLGARAAGLRQDMVDARLQARTWTREHGEDMPEVAQWVWPG